MFFDNDERMPELIESKAYLQGSYWAIEFVIEEGPQAVGDIEGEKQNFYSAMNFNLQIQ